MKNNNTIRNLKPYFIGGSGGGGGGPGVGAGVGGHLSGYEAQPTKLPSSSDGSVPLRQARNAHPPPPRLNAVQRELEEHFASHWARVVPRGILSKSGQSLLLKIAPLGHRFHEASTCARGVCACAVFVCF